MVKLTNEQIFYDKSIYEKINYGWNKHKWNSYGENQIAKIKLTMSK
jgi:hypothetical protein